MQYKSWTDEDVAALERMLQRHARFEEIEIAFPAYNAPGISRQVSRMGFTPPRGFSGLVCPRCGSPDLEVKDSRPTDSAIRRRRCCATCDHRFTTHERVAKSQDDIDRALVTLRIIGELITRLEGLVDIEEIKRFLKE